MEKENKDFFKRFGIIFLFIIPIAYIGIIAAVTVHEIFGHGLGTVLVGGKFTSFKLMPDGFGLAYLEQQHLNPEKRGFIYLAGPISTLIFGILFLYLSWVFRKRFFLSLGILVIALNCLLEGPPYLFWNSVVPLPPGDIGGFLELFPSATF